MELIGYINITVKSTNKDEIGKVVLFGDEKDQQNCKVSYESNIDLNQDNIQIKGLRYFALNEEQFKNRVQIIREWKDKTETAYYMPYDRRNTESNDLIIIDPSFQMIITKNDTIVFDINANEELLIILYICKPCYK